MQSMQKYVLVIAAMLAIAACKKPDNGPAEDKIRFTIDATNGAFSAAANYPFKIQLKSKMPADGIKIEILANQEASGAGVTPQTPAFTTKDTLVNTAVSNLPRQLWVVTKVRVSSVTSPLNKDSSNFRVIFK
jgi:hypothetical protein